MQENPARSREADTRDGSRKALIVAAAVQLFAHRGLDGCTMRDIARASGLRAGSIYYHFASKEALFLAAHELAIGRLRAGVVAAVDPAAGPWLQLEQAAGGYLRCMLHQPQLAHLIVIEATSRRAAAALTAQVHSQRRLFEQPFARIVARLPLRRGVDRSAFRLALMGMLAWTHTWWRPDGSDAPDAVARKIVALLRDDNAVLRAGRGQAVGKPG